MAKEMTLYWGHGSPPCYRVMIALGEKELQDKCDYKELFFAKGEHKGCKVMKINSRGQLPAFQHGKIIVNESLAICEYLEETFKGQGTRLIPADPAKKAMMYQRMHEGSNIISKLADVLYYNWRVPECERHDTALQRNREALTTELKLWEGYLSKSDYLVGDEFSLADVSVFPSVAYLFTNGLCEEKYRALAKYYHKLTERPSMKKNGIFPMKPPLQTCLRDVI